MHEKNDLFFLTKQLHTSPLRKRLDMKQESNFWTKKAKLWCWTDPSWTRAKALHYKNIFEGFMAWKRDHGLLFLSAGRAEGEKLISLMLWANWSCRVAFCHRQVVLKLVSALGRSVSWVMVSLEYWHHYPTAFTHWFSVDSPWSLPWSLFIISYWSKKMVI